MTLFDLPIEPEQKVNGATVPMHGEAKAPPQPGSTWDRTPNKKLADQVRRIEQRRAKLSKETEQIMRYPFRADAIYSRAARIARLHAEYTEMTARSIWLQLCRKPNMRALFVVPAFRPGSFLRTSMPIGYGGLPHSGQ